MQLLKKIIEKSISGIRSLVVLPAILYFFFRNRAIFKNNVITVFYETSFGHCALFLDVLSRCFYPYRVSVIYFHTNYSNKFLPKCFAHNVDVFEYTGWPRPALNQSEEARGPGNILIKESINSVLHFIRIFWGGFQIVETPLFCLSVLSMTEGGLSVGSEESGGKAPAHDYTGYMRLVRDKIGKPPQLPENIYSDCKKAIEKTYPKFFEKPFVTLHLRAKRDCNFDDVIRRAGAQENYLAAVKLLIARGYHVVGAGETDHGLFEGLEHYFRPDRLNIDQQYINLFTLTKSCLFIGQQSGPQNFVTSCGIAVLLTDAMPHALGTNDPTSLILRKKLKNRRTNQILSIPEIYARYEDLAFNYNFTKNDIEVVDNNSDEILDAVKETLEILEGKQNLNQEEKTLIEHYNKLPYKEDMLIYYQKNRPPLSVLRTMQSELFKMMSQSREELVR